WLRTYIEERWTKRLTEKPATDANEGVLVLKSEFNTTWNYFNAKELGDVIFNYWNEWYERAARWDFDVSDRSRPFPPPREGDRGTLTSPASAAFLMRVDPPGRELFFVPDIRPLKIVDRRVIVSRKRGRNMFDLTNLWKKTVLQQLDEQVLRERDPEPPAPP
ncbi:hypothetical protein BD311DRAFT_599531, partial [Dichomitus squalens]